MYYSYFYSILPCDKICKLLLHSKISAHVYTKEMMPTIILQRIYVHLLQTESSPVYQSGRLRAAVK